MAGCSCAQPESRSQQGLAGPCNLHMFLSASGKLHAAAVMCSQGCGQASACGASLLGTSPEQHRQRYDIAQCNKDAWHAGVTLGLVEDFMPTTASRTNYILVYMRLNTALPVLEPKGMRDLPWPA